MLHLPNPGHGRDVTANVNGCRSLRVGRATKARTATPIAVLGMWSNRNRSRNPLHETIRYVVQIRRRRRIRDRVRWMQEDDRRKRV